MLAKIELSYLNNEDFESIYNTFRNVNHTVGSGFIKGNYVELELNKLGLQKLSSLLFNYDGLEQKLKKKNELLKKARVKRKNQRLEIDKLNIKLRKSISVEEHNQIMKRVKEYGVSSLESLSKVYESQLSIQDKEIKRLNTIIHYLETKCIKGFEDDNN